MSRSANSQSSTVRRSPYARMFALPGAKAFCAAAAVARLPLSMMSLGIVLALNHMYNNWTVAGAMSACYVLAVAVVTPLYARWFDKFGQRRVGIPALAVQVVVMFGFAFCALFRVPIPVLFALAIVVGATQFSFGALVRTRWTYVLERSGNEDLIDSAYTIESAIDEIVFVLGPILAATLATSFHPVSQLFVPAFASAIGGIIFFSLRDTMPPVLRSVTVRTQTVEQTQDELELGQLPQSAVTEAAPSGWTASGKQYAAAVKPRNVLLYAGILPLVLAFVMFNMSFSAFDVSITAAMEHAGVDRFLGLQLAMLALGSFIGAMYFGSRAHRGSHWRRLIMCLAIVAVGFAIMHTVMDSFIALGVAELLTGLFVSPMFATGNLIVKDTVPDESLTEGFSWLTTAGSVGASLGSLIGGILLDHIDEHAGVMMTWIVVAAAIPFAALGWFIVSRKNRREFAHTPQDERKY